jgi:hypothetical protein
MSTACQAPTPRRYPGRTYLWLAVALALLTPVVFGVQVFGLKILRTPWYLPVLGTLSLLLIVAALIRARSVWRIINVLWIGLLAAGEWFILAASTLPEYAGPVQVGQPFPAFTTTLAGGETFTQEQLKGDRNTVMVFFRGRW